MKSLTFILFSILSTLHLASQNVEVTTHETCLYLTNGEIHVEINPTFVSGYSLPYIVNWENITTGTSGTIEIESLDFQLKNLDVGNYNIEIKIGTSCEINFTAEVEGIPTIPLKVLRKVQKPTCGYSNGNITLILEEGTGPYKFIWEPEATTFTHPNIPGAYMLANVPAGFYCVTVTDQECGYAELCVEVKEMFPNVKIQVVDEISDCTNNCDGKIEISIKGVTGPFSVEWEGPDGEIVGAGTTLLGLCDPGMYIARVYFSDRCQPWIYNILLTCCGGGANGLQVTLDSENGCNGDNSIETIVSGGTLPYTYQWSNYSSSPNLTGVPNGEYTVTVTDANGCQTSASASFNPVEQLDVVKPCANLADGEITFQINNPNNCPVDVTYDFSICSDCTPYPLIDNNSNSTITFTLEDLQGGVEYSYYVYMCGCTQEIHFVLEEEPFEKSFVDFDQPKPDVYVCNYDLECRNNEGNISNLATLDLNHEDCDPTTWPRPCGQVDYYCDPSQPPIASKEIKKKYMRRGEAILLAQDLGIYNPEEIAFQIGGNPCDRIWVCPNAPICRGLALTGEFGGHWQGNDPVDSHGCYKVKCKFLGVFGLGFSYKICGKDYFPSYLAPYYDPTIPISININGSNPPCIPIEKNAIEIARFFTELEAVPGFKGSDLHSFIKLNLNDPRLRCAKVTYCDSNFKMIDDDLDEVECAPIEEYVIGGACSNVVESCQICELAWEPDDSYVWCATECAEKPGETCFEPRKVVKNFEDFDISGFSSSIPSQIVSRMSSSTKFLSFSPVIQNDSMMTVNAIYQNGGEKLYHAFSYDRLSPFVFDNLEYLFQHFDSSYAFAIGQNTDSINVKDIFYIDGDNFYETKLKGTQSLSLVKNWSENNFHFLTGIFKGNLSQKSQLISSSVSYEHFFMLKTDRELNNLNFRKVSKSGWNIFIDEQSGNIALWSQSGSALYIDDQLQNGISTREIVTLDAGSTGTIRDLNFILPSTMKLKEYKRGPNYSGYLVVGRGSITLQGNQIYNNATDKVILISIKNSGSGSLLKWTKSFILSAIDTTSIAIEMVGQDSLYLALNSTNSISTEAGTISNNGGKDIILLGYNSTGNLVLSDHYGSNSDEILKDFYYSNGILFMGGELGGNAFRRTIGDLDFVNFSPSLNHAFISYKVLYHQPETEELVGMEEIVQNGKTLLPNVEVFPNPANDEIYIRANQNCSIARIIIRNAGGGVVAEKEISKENLSNGFLFECTDWSSGVYVASISSGCSQLLSKPFIITH